RPGGAVRAEESAAQTPPRLQREDPRLPGLPAIRQGRRRRRSGGTALGRGRRGLPALGVRAGRRERPVVSRSRRCDAPGGELATLGTGVDPAITGELP